MSLSQSQKQTLKTDALANQATVDTPSGTVTIASLFAASSLDAGNAQLIADWYNSQASPDFWVFEKFVTKMDIKESAIDWAEHLALTEIQLLVFASMTEGGGFNPQPENIRNGLQSIFSGAGQANTRNAIIALSTHLASEVEKVFSAAATGPAGGNGSSQTNCAITSYDGSMLSANDMQDIHGIP